MRALRLAAITSSGAAFWADGCAAVALSLFAAGGMAAAGAATASQQAAQPAAVHKTDVTL